MQQLLGRAYDPFKRPLVIDFSLHTRPLSERVLCARFFVPGSLVFLDLQVACTNWEAIVFVCLSAIPTLPLSCAALVPTLALSCAALVEVAIVAAFVVIADAFHHIEKYPHLSTSS